MIYQFKINDLEIEVDYPQEDIEEVYLPLLEKLTNLQKAKNRRLIVFLAAPPGCGKTTLSYFLQYLSNERKEITPIQALGIDGFQYTQNYLNNTMINGKFLAKYKGSPETFDVDSLIEKIQKLLNENISWPLYSRKLHDPIYDAIKVEKDIILIEGNYLLLNQGKWAELKSYCDYSIFLKNDYDLLEKRLVERKVMGGSSLKEATEHYQVSDSKNVLTVLNNSLPADLVIELNDNKVKRD